MPVARGLRRPSTLACRGSCRLTEVRCAVLFVRRGAISDGKGEKLCGKEEGCAGCSSSPMVPLRCLQTRMDKRVEPLRCHFLFGHVLRSSAYSACGRRWRVVALVHRPAFPAPRQRPLWSQSWPVVGATDPVSIPLNGMVYGLALISPVSFGVGGPLVRLRAGNAVPGCSCQGSCCVFGHDAVGCGSILRLAGVDGRREQPQVRAVATGTERGDQDVAAGDDHGAHRAGRGGERDCRWRGRRAVLDGGDVCGGVDDFGWAVSAASRGPHGHG